MKVLVLGSGADASDTRRATTAVCSALAISADGRRWVLVNAAPDIGVQLRRHAMLDAPLDDRHDDAAAPIRAVVLTSAAIDSVVGLLSLRDGPPLDVYATPSVFEDLTGGLPLLNVLQHYCGVRWHLLGVAGEQRTALFHVGGAGSLVFEALALPGRALPYSSHRNDPSPGDRIALRVFDPATRRRLVYASDLAETPHDALDELHDADCLLVDGTAAVLRELLARSRATRKVLLSRASPLGDGSEVELAYAGMELEL
jgi:pyrroloquinoline quinone biosynthesis protein B